MDFLCENVFKKFLLSCSSQTSNPFGQTFFSNLAFLQQQIIIDNFWLKDHLHWQCYFGKKIGDSADIDNKVTEYVLALATLGDATRNRNNPICVTQPKVAKASAMACVTCHCHWRYCNKLRQCKHSLRLI